MTCEARTPEGGIFDRFRRPNAPRQKLPDAPPPPSSQTVIWGDQRPLNAKNHIAASFRNCGGVWQPYEAPMAPGTRVPAALGARMVHAPAGFRTGRQRRQGAAYF